MRIANLRYSSLLHRQIVKWHSLTQVSESRQEVWRNRLISKSRLRTHFYLNKSFQVGYLRLIKPARLTRLLNMSSNVSSSRKSHVRNNIGKLPYQYHRLSPVSLRWLSQLSMEEELRKARMHQLIVNNIKILQMRGVKLHITSHNRSIKNIAIVTILERVAQEVLLRTRIVKILNNNDFMIGLFTNYLLTFFKN